MFDHLLESSRRDDSNKWSNIGYCEGISEVESIENNFTHLIWGSGCTFFNASIAKLLNVVCFAHGIKNN